MLEGRNAGVLTANSCTPSARWLLSQIPLSKNLCYSDSDKISVRASFRTSEQLKAHFVQCYIKQFLSYLKASAKNWTTLNPINHLKPEIHL
jgi:hypothetical protein